MAMEPKMFSISIRTIMLFRGLYTLLRKEIRNSKYLKQIGNEDPFFTTLDPSYLKKMVKSRLIVKMKTTVCFHSIGSFFHSSVMFG